MAQFQQDKILAESYIIDGVIPHKKINREKPRLNREFRFINEISRDLNKIFSNLYFMKLTWLNLSKISVSLGSV